MGYSEYLLKSFFILLLAYASMKLIKKIILGAREKIRLFFVKSMADSTFKTSLKKFEKLKKRKATRNEKVGLIVQTSHEVMKESGERGHWKRQKIRKFLSERYKVVSLYKMK